jgi:hypothetical protein
METANARAIAIAEKVLEFMIYLVSSRWIVLGETRFKVKASLMPIE